jgi:hypothetical protein
VFDLFLSSVCNKNVPRMSEKVLFNIYKRRAYFIASKKDKLIKNFIILVFISFSFMIKR